MLRSILVLFAAFLLSLPLSRHAAGATPVQVDRPNIILLFADDMGYGDLSSFGSPTIVTPHLDRMADEGVRLTSFYAAASVCSPSRVGLMTGRYPVRMGINSVFFPESWTGLPPEERTLAEELREAGYATGAVVDITEHRVLEERLRQSERRLQAFLDNAPPMMGVVELADDDSDILHVLDNIAAEQTFSAGRGATAGRWARRFRRPSCRTACRTSRCPPVLRELSAPGRDRSPGWCRRVPGWSRAVRPAPRSAPRSGGCT